VMVGCIVECVLRRIEGDLFMMCVVLILCEVEGLIWCG